MNEHKPNSHPLGNQTQSERNFNLFMQAPVAICIVKGVDYTVELANDGMLEILGRTSEIIGKPIIQSLPEARIQGLIGILDNVRNSGEPYFISTFPVVLLINGQRIQKYFDLVFKPYFEDGSSEDLCRIFCVAHNVTDQVAARNKLSESEDRYRTLIEESTVAMALYIGPDIRIQYANKIMLNYWGKDESVIGKPISEGLPELKGQHFVATLKNVYHTGIEYTGKNEEAWIKVNNKLQPFYFSFTYKALRNSNGEVYGIHHIAIDVTKEVQASMILQEEKERTKLAIAVGELGVFDLDLETNEVDADERFNAIFGFDSTKNFSDYLSRVHPMDLERSKEIVWAGDEPEILEQQFRLLLDDHQERWVRFRGHYYRKDNTKPARLFGVIQDITKQKEFEHELSKQVAERTAELESKNKELERSNQDLEEFAHVASHDLKQPIRKIQFFSERLKQQLADRLNEDENSTFQRIQVASQRMGLLIDDLLLYSHVSQRPPEMEDVDLNEKVGRALEDLELEIQQKNAKIHVGKLPVVKGYRRQLQQLLLNLIGNALKYNIPGVNPEIEISSRIVHNIELDSISQPEGVSKYYRIDIKDNGIGFDQEHADRIFKLFHRLHGNAEYGGTGVGLSIAQKVAKNHHGKIIAESEEGKGATFKVFLPVEDRGRPGSA